MATKKKGILIPTLSWNKHLRKEGKRRFWSRHRMADKKLCRQE